MGRISVKKDKKPYQLAREELHLSREKASDLLGGITPERIEKFESDAHSPHPDEVLMMARTYKKPLLCNYYCANECPIGKEYVPEIKAKDLSQIVLEILASLNLIQKQRDRLIEITVDSTIAGEEVADFVHIQEELERISVMAETLQLWMEQKLATGNIDKQAYEAYKKEKK